MFVWVVDAVGDDLPVGRDFVGTIDEGVDGCCFITLGALTITVQVDTRVSGFIINGCIKTCVSFRDINFQEVELITDFMGELQD